MTNVQCGFGVVGRGLPGRGSTAAHPELVDFMAYWWPINDLAESASEVGFVKSRRILRESREHERRRRSHRLIRGQEGDWAMGHYPGGYCQSSHIRCRALASTSAMRASRSLAPRCDGWAVACPGHLR